LESELDQDVGVGLLAGAHGQPVARRFSGNQEHVLALRKQLGWSRDRPAAQLGAVVRHQAVHVHQQGADGQPFVGGQPQDQVLQTVLALAHRLVAGRGEQHLEAGTQTLTHRQQSPQQLVDAETLGGLGLLHLGSNLGHLLFLCHVREELRLAHL
ncbi:unnamed protein product, partial [Ixodes pacificus]